MEKTVLKVRLGQVTSGEGLYMRESAWFRARVLEPSLQTDPQLLQDLLPGLCLSFLISVRGWWYSPTRPYGTILLLNEWCWTPFSTRFYLLLLGG